MIIIVYNDYPKALRYSSILTEETESIWEIADSRLSVPFSSGSSKPARIAFKPKAMGWVSKEIFLAPSDSSSFLISDSILSMSASGESGIILNLIITVAIFEFKKEGI